MRKRLYFLLFEAHTSVLEFSLAIEMLTVGLWFLNPFYATFSSSISYSMMQSIGNEDDWGVVLVAVALLHLYALLAQMRLARRLWLSLATFLWIFMSFSFVISNPQALGSVLFVLNAFGCLLCLMRPEKPLVETHVE